MSNSSLVSYTKISPNKTSPRNHAIDTITLHCVVGQCSVETLGEIFAVKSRKASSTYGIGADGRVGQYVDENDRSWCSSSSANDNRAITIECASDTVEPYAINTKVFKTILDLCVDICQRNGKKKLIWFGDKKQTLDYTPAADEMLLTVHRWFSATECPGEYIYERLGNIAAQVTAKLSAAKPVEKTLYRVQTGSFRNKQYADGMFAKVKDAGFDVYMVKVNGLYKIQVGAFAKKANATTMAKKLEKAGFETYITTQAGTAVEASALKSIDEIAKEVLRGDWGNGTDRKNRLTKAGYDYAAVQKRVEEMLG